MNDTTTRPATLTDWKSMIEQEKLGCYLGPIYGVRYDGSICRIEVIYNHSTRAEFHTHIIGPKGKTRTHYGHPKRNGVTKTNNWSIDPEFIGGDW